jgi:hypothetical protein
VIAALRKHWLKMLPILVVAYFFLGFPPGLPSSGSIMADFEKRSYVSGERVKAVFYIENNLPIPVRVQGYDEARYMVTKDSEQVGSTVSDVVTDTSAGSMHLPPKSRRQIFSGYGFTPMEPGEYEFSVTLFRDGNLVNQGMGTVEVYPQVHELSEPVKEVIRETLRIALVEGEIPDYEMILENDPIVVSSENLGNYDPVLEGFSFLVLTPEEIEERLLTEGNYLYLRFKRVTMFSDDSAVVELDNRWVRGVWGGVGYLSGGGFTIYLNRVGDGWEHDVASMWIA